MKHIKLFESFLSEDVAWTKGEVFDSDENEVGLYVVEFEGLGDRLVYFFYGIQRGDSVAFVYDPTSKEVYSYEVFEAGRDGYDAPEMSDGMGLMYYCEPGPKIISIHYAAMSKAESDKLINDYDKLLEINFEKEEEEYDEDNY